MSSMKSLAAEVILDEFARTGTWLGRSSWAGPTPDLFP
jgi:hypothetical protein